jgi:hypothetical protein
LFPPYEYMWGQQLSRSLSRPNGTCLAVGTICIPSSSNTSMISVEHYDEKYAATYGRYRLERIRQLGERFTTCGDYLQGVARIRCTNPECGHDYFRPFSCKGFYLCPSCSRKRTILFRRASDKGAPAQSAASPVRIHDAESTPAVLSPRSAPLSPLFLGSTYRRSFDEFYR